MRPRLSACYERSRRPGETISDATTTERRFRRNLHERGKESRQRSSRTPRVRVAKRLAGARSATTAARCHSVPRLRGSRAREGCPPAGRRRRAGVGRDRPEGGGRPADRVDMIVEIAASRHPSPRASLGPHDIAFRTAAKAAPWVDAILGGRSTTRMRCALGCMGRCGGCGSRGG
jgi:hypothetical protein